MLPFFLDNKTNFNILIHDVVHNVIHNIIQYNFRALIITPMTMIEGRIKLTPKSLLRLLLVFSLAFVYNVSVAGNSLH